MTGDRRASPHCRCEPRQGGRAAGIVPGVPLRDGAFSGDVAPRTAGGRTACSLAGDAQPSSQFPDELSARQLKSTQNMVHANLSGWLVRVQDRVRELVTGSNLPEHQKTLLYRINARKAWWVPTRIPVGHRRAAPGSRRTQPPRQDTRGGVDCRGARDIETGAPASQTSPQADPVPEPVAGQHLDLTGSWPRRSRPAAPPNTDVSATG